MLATLDYTSVIRTQYYCVEKSKKSLDFFNSGLGKVVNSIRSPKSILRKVNSILISQLVSSRGLLITAQEKNLEIKDKDLTKAVTGVNKLLELNIVVQSLVDELLENNNENKYPELYLTRELLSETIENFYSILRILKKANLKTPKETSQLARDLSRVSVNSLEKVLYGR
jgi:hypothetical protein